MKVGWLRDDPGYVGGAELTQAEFRTAAPEGVEVIDCPQGAVVPGLDRYVVHNCVGYTPEDMRAKGSAPALKYVHDQWPDGFPEVREWLCDRARLIFCSPLHKERFPWPYQHEATVIPPALDLDRFEPNGMEREGTCSIAAWRNAGKGGQLLDEWADENGTVDVYGDGPFVPHGKKLEVKGPVPPERVPAVLHGYDRFVFLPTDIEPFCRSVVEAWASGCRVVTNRLVGARYFLEEAPGELENAAETFWETVTDV